MTTPFKHKNAFELEISHREFPALPSTKPPSSSQSESQTIRKPALDRKPAPRTEWSWKSAAPPSHPKWPSLKYSPVPFNPSPASSRDITQSSPEYPPYSPQADTLMSTSTAGSGSFEPFSQKKKTTVWNAPGKLPPLLRLPVELHKDILDILKLAPTATQSILCLRLVNRYFYTLVPAPSHAMLLTAEREVWACRLCLYACRYCLRLRKGGNFADAMLKGRTGLNGKEPAKRFCVDCGLHPRPGETRYSPGAEIVVKGERRVWCKICSQVKKGADAIGCTGVCGACHGRNGCRCQGEGRLQGTAKVKKKKRRRAGVGGWMDYEDDVLGEYAEMGIDFWECYDPS